MNLFPLSDIVSSTSLSTPFIRKCLTRMPQIFEPYLHRGRNNAIQLEDSSLMIFQQIAQLKEQGHDLPGIMRELSKTGLPGTEKPVVKPEQNAMKPQDFLLAFELYDKLDQERKRALEEKEAKLQAISDFNALKLGLRLLTGGKIIHTIWL